jgi:uncharacterized membrane protein
VDVSIITAVISVLAALSGIVLGWTARAREVKKGIQTEAEVDATIKTDISYIKRGIDEIRIEQRVQSQRVDTLTERVAKVEESSKQAHKRIDRIEQERGG